MLAVELWNACAVPWKLPLIVGGRPIAAIACSIAVDRVAERVARREVERDRDRRQLAGVIDRQRARCRRLTVRDRVERHQRAAGCRRT